METLVVVAAQHKHQYCTARPRPQGLARLHSSPPNKFREISCRTFRAGAEDGILPTPLRASSTPMVKQTPPSLKTPASPPQPHTEPARSRPARRSSPIPINAKSLCNESEGFFGGSLSFSERWAGPTYSNSPPPSSLPIPKFLQLPKRSNSLDLPNVGSEYDDVFIHPISKSAPTSPTREFSPPASRDLFRTADSATKTLRRILNLEPSDE